MVDRRAIIDYLSRERRPCGVRRELSVEMIPGKIVSVVGPRRSGKTCFLYQLLERHQDALYLNFENIFLRNLKPEEVFEVIKIFVELRGREPELLLLDEVQEISNWQFLLRTLLDYGYRLVVTGSSSKLLPRELSTELRGRSIHYLLLPFSFREFLKTKGVNVASPLTYENEGRILRLLREYLDWGGFPEVVLSEEKYKERILHSYFEETFVKDFVERHSIKSVQLARLLFEFVFQNFSKELSISRLERALKPSVGLSRKTLYSYLEKLEDTLTVFFVDRYHRGVYKRREWPKKVYVVDTGMTRFLRFDTEIGKLMENAVFLELLRLTNERPAMSIYYWREKEEVDFVVKEGSQITALIQVSYTEDKIDSREMRALEKVSKLLKPQNKILITWDVEDLVEGVKAVPLWKFLLNPNAILQGSKNP